MNRLACLASVLIASVTVITAHAPRAQACSPPPAVWVTEPAGVPITGVPVQGVVPIFSENEPGASDRVGVSVLDASDQAVPGSWEVFRWRLVWRSDAPLEPSATYRMSIEDDWGQVTEVVFVTAAADAPEPGLPSLTGASWLGEEARPDSEICCEGEDIDTCSGLLVETCWTQSWAYLPRLSVAFDIDETARRYALFDVDAGTGEVVNLLDASGAQQVAAVFGATQVSYCATVTAMSLLDGDTVSAESCRSDGDRVPAERLEPEVPDDSLCGDGGGGGEDDKPWDHDDWDEDEWKTDGDDRGCAAAGGGGGGGALYGLLMVLPLAARRARRRRGG